MGRRTGTSQEPSRFASELPRRSGAAGRWGVKEFNRLSLSHQPEQRTCHFSGRVCSIPTSLLLSLSSRAWLGHLVIGEEAHTPGFLTGSLSPNLSFFKGCVQRDSLSLSFWRSTRWVGGRRRTTHTRGLLISSPSPHTTLRQ